ncbi:MAG: M23 family metallopeptidase [Saccharospirillaceae bacterium]|nr:M23 family metallopeptidase [Saccharospirillaceae bacterium]
MLDVTDYIATSLVLDFVVTGLISAETLPITVFMDTPQKMIINTFTKTGSWSINYNSISNVGALGVTHNNSILYQLPFAIGSTKKVSQGYNGQRTHQNVNAIDFNLDEGTEIFVMRAGRVVKIEQQFNEGGFDDNFKFKANYVQILHDDLTLAKYVHLKLNGVVVQHGQLVQAGDLIGYSGNTGYSSGPHLHISVSALDTINKSLTFQTIFKTASNLDGEILEEGKSYTAID